MAGSDNLKRLSTDVLIMGAGGAGMRAAIEAHENGAKVIMLSKSVLGKAHTVMAEGGIAASLGSLDAKDSWQVHFADTIAEGVYINNYKMAELLVKEAAERVYELERYGALFDRTDKGKIMQRAFGAHTYRRLCHVGDRTGLEIMQTLKDKIIHYNIPVMDEFVVTRIATLRGRVIGVIGLEIRTGRFVAIDSKAIIISAGGSGGLYKVTSNSWESTGDGAALAFKAGAELMDMEMVQFHPTGMVYPPGVKGLLVTEGIRGEGGILLNTKGERFMSKYSPKRMELDARDVVARAIHFEILAGNGTEHGGVYLDISHMGAEFIKKKLPSMLEQFKTFAGVDITKEKMEVAPTVHYHMGGIRVDAEKCNSRIKGLFAAGEVTGGVHGANRLGGNSLADILVFGKRAGHYAAAYSKLTDPSKINNAEIEREMERINSYAAGSGLSPFQLIDELRESMSSNVGIIRNEEALRKGIRTIEAIRKRATKARSPGELKYNHGLLACIRLENMLITAEAIIRSALCRKESRGAHTRSDFPKKSREWLKNVVCVRRGNKIAINTVPVPKMPPRLKGLVKTEEYE